MEDDDEEMEKGGEGISEFEAAERWLRDTGQQRSRRDDRNAENQLRHASKGPRTIANSGRRPRSLRKGRPTADRVDPLNKIRKKDKTSVFSTTGEEHVELPNARR